MAVETSQEVAALCVNLQSSGVLLVNENEITVEPNSNQTYHTVVYPACRVQFEISPIKGRHGSLASPVNCLLRAKLQW